MWPTNKKWARRLLAFFMLGTGVGATPEILEKLDTDDTRKQDGPV